MFTFGICMADVSIEVKTIFDTTRKLCQNYLTTQPCQFQIETTQQDIDYEKERSAEEDRREGIPRRFFTDDYLETLAVYRKIANRLIDYNILLFHGSVVALDGQGYLFTAKSGTGKSTHTRLWMQQFGDRCMMVNDDKPLIRVTDSGVTVYGTPWNGKHRLDTNIAVPLKAVCILERDTMNHIKPVEKKRIYPMMVQQTYRIKDAKKMKRTFELLDVFMQQVSIYRLGCNMEQEAALVAYEGMRG